MSTLVVLLNYYAFVTERKAPSKLSSSVTTVVVGVIALLFRQTNVFWVAIFPAGLAVVEALKEVQDPRAPVLKGVGDLIQNAWSHGQIYDSYVQDALLDGMVLHFKRRRFTNYIEIISC